MLHEAIFLATCLATNIARQVARKISRVTPQFCNLQRQQNVALRVARKAEISCVTCPSKPATQFCENQAIRARLLLAGDFKLAEKEL